MSGSIAASSSSLNESSSDHAGSQRGTGMQAASHASPSVGVLEKGKAALKQNMSILTDQEVPFSHIDLLICSSVSLESAFLFAIIAHSCCSPSEIAVRPCSTIVHPRRALA